MALAQIGRRRPDARTVLDPARSIAALLVAALASTLVLAGPTPAWAAPAGGDDPTAQGSEKAEAPADEPSTDEAAVDAGVPDLAPVPRSAAEVPVHLGTGTVQLTSSTATLEIGQAFRLTARVDEALELTGRVLEIVESTDGDAVVQTCTTGTTCTADVSGFLTGGPRVYVARVGDLTSGEVTVERRPWTVSLAAPTQFSTGSSITFTVKANQRTTKTDGNYTVHIQDLTTGQVAGTCETDFYTSGSDYTCTASTRYYTGGPRDYRAVIASTAGPDVDVQAISNTITVQRTPWTVSLSAPTQFSSGSSITFTVKANQRTTKTDGNYTVHIQDLTTGQVAGTCETDFYTSGSDYTCTASTRYLVGDAHDYRAVIAHPDNPDHDTQAISQIVSTGRTPWTVSLAAPTQFSTGSSITFTVKANQRTTKTDGNYTVHIQDLTTGQVAGTCETDFYTSGSDYTCTASTRYYTGGPRDYRAVIASPAGPDHDVQAISNTITVQRTPWTVSLSAPTQFSAGSSITFTVKANQRTAKTEGNYTVHIQDLTTGQVAGTCETDFYTSGSDYTCTASTRYYTGGPRDYRAVIASPAGPDHDVQAISNTITVQRTPWTITLASSVSQAASGQYVTFTATMNQLVQNTAGHYVAHLVDATTGRSVDTCASASSSRCSWRILMPEGGPRVYRAVVASPSGPHVDVQAVSNTFVGPTLGGPNQRCESSGGTNPSQSVAQRCHGDPVNSATGELFDNAIDLDTEGDLLAPAWTRSYGTSRAETDLGLGHGWTFGYAMSLVPDEGDDLADAPWIEVHQENGSTILFARDEAGGFVTAARVLATLVRNADGTYRLQRHGGDGFVFDAQGRLLRIEDRNGNTVSLTRDAGGRLVSVADQRGRSITVHWSDGRIVGVGDSTGRSVSYAYSPDGDLTEITMADGTTRGYEYDSQHRVVALVDALGGEHRNVYDSQSRVAQQTDPLGNVTAFGYTTGKTTVTGPDGAVTVEEYSDDQLVAETIGYGTARAATTRYVYGPTNHVAAVTDPVGRITQFTHDARGNVLTEVDPLGRVTRSTYDDHDNVLTRTDATGATWTYDYDSAGNLVSETDPLGAVTVYARNPDGTLASTTDPLGHSTTFDHDAYGNVVSIVDADGATSTRTVDPNGHTSAETNARGGTTTYTRDGLGRITSVTGPDGGTTSFDLDAAGNVLREVGPDGAEHAATYDALGRLTSTTDPLGSVTLLEHDPAGRLVAETDPEGGTTRWTYDPDGALMAVTDALGRTVRYTRDRAGRMTNETLPSGVLTVHGYDAAGQHVSTRDPLGGTTTIEYDRAGRPEKVVDADGRTTTTTRDAAGQTMSVTRSDGTSVGYAYDLAGRLTSYTDADGRSTTYAYDTVGQVTLLTDDAGRATAFDYDTAGNVSTVTAPDATVTTRRYDAASRLVEVDHGGQERTTFTYDAAGRRTSMTDATGTTGYTYDAAGHVLEVASPQGMLRYGWTTLGELARLTHPDGSAVSRDYDAAGQLVAVTDWDGGRYDLTWDDDGRLDTVTYPNGVTERQTYDGAGRTKRATTTSGGSALLDLAWTYSPAGLLTSETSERADGVTRSSTYEWDAQARLGSVTGRVAGDLGFDVADRVTQLVEGTVLGYDPVGHISTATFEGIEIRFGHDGRGNRVSENAPGRGARSRSTRPTASSASPTSRPRGPTPTTATDCCPARRQRGRRPSRPRRSAHQNRSPTNGTASVRRQAPRRSDPRRWTSRRRPSSSRRRRRGERPP